MKKKLSKGGASLLILFFFVPLCVLGIVVNIFVWNDFRYYFGLSIALIMFLILLFVEKKEEMLIPIYYDEQGVYYKDREIKWDNLYLHIYAYRTANFGWKCILMFCEKEIETYFEYETENKKYFWKWFDGNLQFLEYYKKPIYFVYKNQIIKPVKKILLRWHKKMRQFEIKEKIIYDN